MILGALIVGDSIKYSLKMITYQKLGKTQYVATVGNRFFGNELIKKLKNILKTPVSACIITSGKAVIPGSQNQIPEVQIIGIDKSFHDFRKKKIKSILTNNEVFINKKTAQKLNAKKNDILLLRIFLSSSLPADSPFSDENTVILKVKVKKILDIDELSDFSIKMDHIIPENIFIDIH